MINCRYTSIYLVLFAATLFQYFFTSSSSPGYFWLSRVKLIFTGFISSLWLDHEWYSALIYVKVISLCIYLLSGMSLMQWGHGMKHILPSLKHCRLRCMRLFFGKKIFLLFIMVLMLYCVNGVLGSILYKWGLLNKDSKEQKKRKKKNQVELRNPLSGYIDIRAWRLYAKLIGSLPPQNSRMKIHKKIFGESSIFDGASVENMKQYP